MLECGMAGTSSTTAGERVRVSGYLPAGAEASARIRELRSRLRGLDSVLTDGGVVEVTVAEVDEADWAEAWKRHFKPVHVGARIVVRPTWERHDALAGELVIALDPGMAFGTGTHETTQLCIRALEDRVHGGEAVIDVGCGSGILAIAAALLGAESVLAIDNDPVAVEVCAGNAARNGLADRVRTRAETGLDGVVSPADVIVANINAEAVSALAPNAAALLLPGGSYITSGFTARGLARTRRAIADAGLTVAEERSCGEWLCLTATRGRVIVGQSRHPSCTPGG
jgi:ribosomal protein L11 methyltransferase